MQSPGYFLYEPVIGAIYSSASPFSKRKKAAQFELSGLMILLARIKQWFLVAHFQLCRQQL